MTIFLLFMLATRSELQVAETMFKDVSAIYQEVKNSATLKERSVVWRAIDSSYDKDVAVSVIDKNLINFEGLQPPKLPSSTDYEHAHNQLSANSLRRLLEDYPERFKCLRYAILSWVL